MSNFRDNAFVNQNIHVEILFVKNMILWIKHLI